MIIIENKMVAHVPTLHIVENDIREKRDLPVVFFFHGYNSAKEHNLHVAYLLAEKGFRVFLPDALHHGERDEGLVGSKRDLTFWEIVLTSIRELELMKQELEGEVILDAAIGVMGTSMGAIAMYGALARYEWIQTAVSFMGTAYYEAFARAQLEMIQEKGIHLEPKLRDQIFEQLKPFDLSAQLDKLAGRPLFIWHGKEDHVVPYPFSEKLYHELVESYEYKPEKLQLFVEERIAHKVSRQAVLKSVKWFEDHLLVSRVSS